MIQEALLTWRYIDTDSNLIMPWYTLPALKWLKEQDIKKWDVFEYGCGYSTIWWRLNSRAVISIDSSEDWAKAVKAELRMVNFSESLMGAGWDCIIVDAEEREKCVQNCIAYLRQGGYLIIDNYGQDDFLPDAVERTEELLKDWTKVVHKQPNHSTWATAIFQKTI